MQITYDPAKREKTLLERGLDFARAGEIFANYHFTKADLRQGYPEERWITIGVLDHRMIVLVWALRGWHERRIISMRKANEREQQKYRQYLERSG
jgi:uncharacterized DUF497 family protein